MIDLAIALLAALAGVLGMLWLLLLWVGDWVTTPIKPGTDDPISGARDQIAIHEAYGPFIPMPEHLKTRDEMVAWMTKELPKLMAELPKPPV